jgi:hypothetical protein
VIITQEVVYTGDLLANQPKTVTVSCTTVDPDAILQVVRADLFSLGGSNAQVLAPTGGDTWSWTGEIWPSAAGNMDVTFTAVSTPGFIVTAKKTVPVK